MVEHIIVHTLEQLVDQNNKVSTHIGRDLIPRRMPYDKNDKYVGYDYCDLIERFSRNLISQAVKNQAKSSLNHLVLLDKKTCTHEGILETMPYVKISKGKNAGFKGYVFDSIDSRYKEGKKAYNIYDPMTQTSNFSHLSNIKIIPYEKQAHDQFEAHLEKSKNHEFKKGHDISLNDKEGVIVMVSKKRIASLGIQFKNQVIEEWVFVTTENLKKIVRVF
jgi:hypothetical protein